MGLTVFKRFPQLTRLLDRIVHVGDLVEVGWMPFVQELKWQGDELHELFIFAVENCDFRGWHGVCKIVPRRRRRIVRAGHLVYGATSSASWMRG